MADMQTCFGSTDIFGMEAISTSFHVQSSNTNHSVERVEVRAKDGGIGCTFNDINGKTEYSATYKYCGSTLAAHMDTLMATFGAVRSSKLITEVQITFNSTDVPEITISGHNHDANAHDTGATAPDTFDADGLIAGATGGVGTFDIFGLGGVSTCVSSSSITYSIEHDDYTCSSGDHGVGINKTASAEATVEYIGQVDEGALAGGWTYVSSDYSDSNDDTCKESITAYRQLAKNA